MFAIYARYRGKDRHRAELVRQSAAALSSLQGMEPFIVTNVEDIFSTSVSASSVCDTAMALLATGEWAVGLVILEDAISDPTQTQKMKQEDTAQKMGLRALGRHPRAGKIYVLARNGKRIDQETSHNIEAVFTMLAFILNKRTAEGRHATSLMRSGMNQNEAAQELEISKQAMSQRLQAAGWQAETAGYRLAINLLQQASPS